MRIVPIVGLVVGLTLSSGTAAQSIPSTRNLAPLNAPGGVPIVDDTRMSDEECAASDWLHQGNYEKAVPALQALAQDGNAWAMREIGWLFANGRGVAADSHKALGWFFEAAIAGDERSMLILGTSFSRGYGVERDDDLARAWLQLAGESSNREVAGAAADELRRL